MLIKNMVNFGVTTKTPTSGLGQSQV